MLNELSQNPAKLNKTEKKKRTIFFAEGLEHVVSPTIARVKH